MTSADLIFRLQKRAEIRRQITTRKSVEEGKPDRIADLLEEAASRIQELEAVISSAPKKTESEPMTEAELKVIEDRVAKALPGPWKAGQMTVASWAKSWTGTGLWEWSGDEENPDDAQFIAAARDDVPALVAEVRKLQAQVDRLHAQMRAGTGSWE